MKEQRIGFFDFGTRTVELRVRTGHSGGSFDGAPPCRPTIMVIGLAHNEWWQVCDVLLHEAIELAAMDLDLRLCRNPDYSSSHGTYSFHMTHAQFEEVVARVARFITPVLLPLATAYKKARGKRDR